MCSAARARPLRAAVCRGGTARQAHGLSLARLNTACRQVGTLGSYRAMSTRARHTVSIRIPGPLSSCLPCGRRRAPARRWHCRLPPRACPPPWFPVSAPAEHLPSSPAARREHACPLPASAASAHFPASCQDCGHDHDVDVAVVVVACIGVGPSTSGTLVARSSGRSATGRWRWQGCRGG